MIATSKILCTDLLVDLLVTQVFPIGDQTRKIMFDIIYPHTKRVMPDKKRTHNSTRLPVVHRKFRPEMPVKEVMRPYM